VSPYFVGEMRVLVMSTCPGQHQSLGQNTDADAQALASGF
jgi:hypothetical protein